MTLPSSPNSISLSQIAVEFSGNPTLNSGDYPLELGEYYGQDNAPTTGAISFSNFHGGDGVPSSGLQYHYDAQISETTTAAGGVEDISINDRTATLTNGAAYNSGDLGKIVFDGVDDYVRVTGYKGVTGKTARTSIVFVKLDAATPSATARALSWGDTSTGGKWGMEFTTSGNFSLGAGGGARQSNYQFTLNQWGMFAATIPEGVTGTAAVGQQVFTSSSNFTVPDGCYSISAVCVGGGGGGGNATASDEPGAGGGGGALSYGTFAVTPGETLSIQVGSGGQNGSTGGTGGTSSISRSGTELISAGGGAGGSSTDSGASGGGVGGSSGGTERSGGGSGGRGGSTSDSTTGAGGGAGAGGYGGNGGEGADRGTTNATAGSGGGGGGGGSGSSTRGGAGGGGVGILGQGSNGAAGSGSTGGGGGSGGNNGSSSTSNTGANGGSYGGGGAGGRSSASGGDGQPGAVRLIWGSGRSYPSTNVGDATPVTGTNSSGFLSDITLYYNATKLVNYSTGSVEVNTASSADVTWGGSLADTSLNPIDGEIAKVLVYNRELTHAEITQIYNAKCVALGLLQLSSTTEGSGSPIDPPVGGASYGYFAGGFDGTNVYSTIDRIDYTNDTATASVRGPLSGSVSSKGGTGNSSYGWFGGGSTPASNISSVDRIDYTNDTATASPRGPLSVTRGQLSATGNSSYGWFGGGSPAGGAFSFTSIVDRIDYANDTATASPRGPLNLAIYNQGVAGNSSYGWFVGGYYPGGFTPLRASQVGRIDYANDTATASPRGPLSAARNQIAGAGNSSYGWFGGGEFPAPTRHSIVERIDYANDTVTASTRGQLSFGRTVLSATGNSSNGWFGGGFTAAAISSVDRITYSNDTVTASPRGPLSVAGYYSATASPAANGLPQ